jgi:hypothetical protein
MAKKRIHLLECCLSFGGLKKSANLKKPSLQIYSFFLDA